MGIKSYIGKRVKQNQGSPEQIRVSDYMTKKLITFKPDQSVMEVMSSLIKNRISGGPVVDENHKLVGIISEGDCMKHISESRYYNQPIGRTKVEDHMETDVETIDGEMNVFDAADKFVKSHKRRFPVIKDGTLVGQVSQMDILKAALRLKGTDWK